MSIAQNIQQIEAQLADETKLIAVTKTQPLSILIETYEAGFRRFGENKVQELVEKYEALPKDIEWHLIGHLQTNKVKYIAPFVHLIHSIDSLKLLQEVNKEAIKNDRIIDCLLQIYIAEEETKFGLSEAEVDDIFWSTEFRQLKNVRIVGLMGMASNTDNQKQIREEFSKLRYFFDRLQARYPSFTEVSMGMSGDYLIATQEGSTYVRVGSAIFGSR